MSCGGFSQTARMRTDNDRCVSSVVVSGAGQPNFVAVVRCLVHDAQNVIIHLKGLSHNEFSISNLFSFNRRGFWLFVGDRTFPAGQNLRAWPEKAFPGSCNFHCSIFNSMFNAICVHLGDTTHDSSSITHLSTLTAKHRLSTVNRILLTPRLCV